MNEWNKEIQNENELQVVISAPKAKELGKRLSILFWLVILKVAGSMMTNQALTFWRPFLHLPGQLLSLVTLCAYGYILLKLSSESSRYRMAAICCLASVAVDAGSSLIPEGFSMASLVGLLTFPVLILAFYGEYSEYMGHSEILRALDDGMALKWKRLWRWCLYSLGVMTGSILLVMFSPALGITALLVGLIGTLIVSVMKLTYLYRTAKIFREYATESSR
nr:hypothetical protein [uncultured Enterocloster sp.]